MKEQLLLLSLVLLAVAALTNHTGFGNSLSLSYASLHNPARNWFSVLYERAQLWFDKDAEELQKEFKEGFEKYKGEIKNIVDGIKDASDKKASKDEVDKLKEDLDGKIKQVQDLADDLQVKSNRLHENQEKQGGSKSLLTLVEEGITGLKSKLSENKTGIISLKQLFENSPAHGKEISIDLKAVSNISGSYALTGANTNIMRAFETEPGVAKDPTAPLFITDLISTGTTDSATIYWTERVLVEGGASQVAEAAKFSQVSAKYEKKSANAKKTAAYAKITEEMVEDVDYIVSEVQDEIVSGPNSIRVLVENQLLTGDGTGENHKGIFTYATPFAVPTGFETLETPTNYDAAKAGILHVVKNNFMPDYMLVNPSDLVNMELTKDANGNYVMPPFVGQNGMVISGVRIASNNRIAEGQFLVGDMKRAKLFMKRQLTLKFFDQNEDDALYDLRTITGSLRAIFRVKGPDQKAFIKGTFADVKNLIKTV
ncbi:hypothetical protein GCM10028807_57920 [Spirosoma daeguense]